jgi:hypothetical protein
MATPTFESFLLSPSEELDLCTHLVRFDLLQEVTCPFLRELSVNPFQPPVDGHPALALDSLAAFVGVAIDMVDDAYLRADTFYGLAPDEIPPEAGPVPSLAAVDCYRVRVWSLQRLVSRLYEIRAQKLMQYLEYYLEPQHQGALLAVEKRILRRQAPIERLVADARLKRDDVFLRFLQKSQADVPRPSPRVEAPFVMAEVMQEFSTTANDEATPQLLQPGERLFLNAQHEQFRPLLDGQAIERKLKTV